MATGVLPLVTGSLTRLAQFYNAAEKTYEGTVRFGFSTDSYDAEGEPTSPHKEVRLEAGEVEALAVQFRGMIEQLPPPFSAKKIHGVPAYKLSRQRKDVTLKPVQVEIKQLEILSVETDRVAFRARVTSGTYLRSVAHDMGQRMGCGAHLERLRRTAVAEFRVEEALTLEQLAEASPGGDRDFSNKCFVHPRKLLPELPSVTADEIMVARIRSGQRVNLPELSRARLVKVFSGQRELIAIATRVGGTLFHAKIVLTPDPADGRPERDTQKTHERIGS